MIVGTLIHDIGDDLAPLGHSQLAAIIRPYVQDEVAWVIEHHGVFKCIIMVTQWVLIKTPVKFIAAINGLIAVKNLSVGIKCHLTPTIPAFRAHFEPSP